MTTGKCSLNCGNKTSEGYCNSTGYCSEYFNTVSNLYNTCSNCKYNDGVVYTSIPPKYRCTITGEFYFGNHQCDYKNLEKMLYNNSEGRKEEKMNREKLYAVEFMRYTNVIGDTVSNRKDGDYKVTGNEKYLKVDELIVKESDLDYYRNFGGGFKNLTFVGYLGEPELIKPKEVIKG